MTYDGSNRKHIRQAEKAALVAENERKLFVAHIMSTLPGRAWMHQLLSSCNIFHTPFVAGAYDITAFKCGGQNIGLQIFADVHASAPREYVLMMQEAATKEVSQGTAYKPEKEPEIEEEQTSKVETEYEPI